MAIKALFRLLFAECYGIKVVFPSMRAIAAWLALWNDDVRQELIRREPEALFLFGDPESLNLTARSELVRAFVVRYGTGGWRGFNISSDQIRRLANPELGALVRELWGEGPTNTDVRELLLKLIRYGPIENCADLAKITALNVGSENSHRIIAIRALLACGKENSVREIADGILIHPSAWPNKVVYDVAGDLFPKIFSVDELIALMERTPEPEQTVGGFDWVSRQIVEAIEPWSNQAVVLRDKMTELVWRGRNSTLEHYRIGGRFDHLIPALAKLCDRQLVAAPEKADALLFRACVIASRFGQDKSGAGEPVGKLKAHFSDNIVWRRNIFWDELAFMDEVSPSKDDWRRYFQAEHYSLLGHLTNADRPWLEESLMDLSQSERRTVALHALIQNWHQSGRVPYQLENLRERLVGDVALSALLVEYTSPREPNEEFERLERRARRQDRVRAASEEQRNQN